MCEPFGAFDGVKLTHEMSGEGRTFPAGSEGAIVHSYASEPPAYIIEMMDEQGRTLALLDVTADDIELVWKDPRRAP